MSFKDLGVNSALIKALNLAGIDKPFPIQKATLPDAIAGKDILGRGQTGSGKTLAFGLAFFDIKTCWKNCSPNATFSFNSFANT